MIPTGWKSGGIPSSFLRRSGRKAPARADASPSLTAVRKMIMHAQPTSKCQYGVGQSISVPSGRSLSDSRYLS